MTTELNDLLTVSPAEKGQIWLVGNRQQVIHLINECYIKKLTTDRARFTPIVQFSSITPTLFATGRYLSILVP